ncbi:hypothetical protein B0H17DRAFT_1186397 [Mycena rosella]|uniref:Uncharacterized protein n=1 Tax=Mycena rosella TaxID=1033263 RepID=A0AAD7CMB2_MYCRO|nr:hypothetical protein B0H17DRAFT_1186397 [Mycena rosella]
MAQPRRSRRKDPQDENQPLSMAPEIASKALTDRIGAHIDPYSDEMEVKHNIEGSNFQDIVFLRQSNDLAERKIQEQTVANAALQEELAEMKARFANDLTNRGRENIDADAGIDKDDTISAALAEARAANAELQKQVAVLSAERSGAADETEQLARPAGSSFNIQNEMGLGKNRKDREIYKALLRNTRDLVLQAGINWELPWAKTPADAKAKLYAVARERHPILQRYVNDWATEEIVKQFIKNKRRHGYKKGFLVPPAEYAYLKANSAKRNPSAPRGRKSAKVAVVAAKKLAAKKKDVTAKASSSKAAGKAKARAKKVVVDEEDESMSEGFGSGRGGYGSADEEED